MVRRNPNHGFTVLSDDWNQEHEEWLDDKDDAVGVAAMMAEEHDPVNRAQYRYASVSVYEDSLDGSREKRRLFHVDRC
jgi:fructose-1,6-bisphosphatase